MDFIKEKIRVMAEKLQELSLISKENISFEYIECPEYKKSNTPPSSGWKPFEEDMRFKGIDDHYWIKFRIKKQEKKPHIEYRLTVKTGREGDWDASNPQCIVYFGNKTVQALDTNHTWLPIEQEKEYEVFIYLYTGMEGGKFDFDVSIEARDLRLEALYYDISVPYECMCLLDEKSEDYIKIRDSLNKALILLDLRDFYSVDFYNSVESVSNYLKEEFYAKICDNKDGNVSCIGHTHIDVAWLWTVRQTREKAQRSFSTVLNMMKRYDDYIFMSSQPQLYQHVKEADPELFEEIKERIKEGRWEAEGAMWLEADTNLISGESLVRQIIYGKRFMKDEFGVDNKILWLPDVFGYSAALPQILLKSGVTQFFTTKMAWNETNEMPNDSFMWEGIDGSRVFTSFVKEYVRDFSPETLKAVRDIYKNKSLTDRAILTFGFGDGGGGPTYAMMEKYERLKHSIPGMPTPVIEKAGNFFDKAEQDFIKNSKQLCEMPVWKGEMYLEMHRGTYTSMGKNKKNNRKSELLYQEAETLAIADTVFNKADYPEKSLRKNYTNILLNQFHDIIPGSSIKEVYDVTDVEYESILKTGRRIADKALDSLISAIDTNGGIFVYNPTPFKISDYIEVDGKTYFANNIPSHGWKVISEIPVKENIDVSDKIIENDVIKVTFNEKYNIVSVYDKESEREILSDDAEANVIEIFEDYPRNYDAWEITSYYKQKKWIADDVSKVEKTENGIRITRKYQKSEIVQDILLRQGSKRIDFVTTVDWHEDHVLMKAAFPVNIRSMKATYDIQFGNIERPTHSNTSWDAAKFEVCGHKWADLSETGYGVSLLNDCKYGYSIEDNVMKITLLKAATWPNPEADRGINTFTYSLFPHNNGFIEGETIKEAYLLNMPLEARVIGENKGSLPENNSIVYSENEGVVLETIKKAENDSSIIVRMYEAFNSKAETVVKTGFDFKKAYICNLLEENLCELEKDGNSVKVQLKNFEILTIKFEI